MTLSQLIYYSDKRELGPGGIQAILEESRNGNSDTHLTGVLLFDQNHFLQCLEGSRAQVTATFCRIAEDQRHANVTLMSVVDIEERDFPDWTMGYVLSSEGLNSVLKEFQPAGTFDPESMSASRAIGLMRRLRDMERTVT